MLRIFAVLTLLIAVFTASGEVSYACGCADHVPMAERDLDRLKARAARGDVTATGDVWFEYVWREDDARATRLWRYRAIRAGDPRVTRQLAGEWMRQAQRASSTRHKRIFIDTAVILLDHGYRNRHLIDAQSGHGFDHQAWYVSQRREAKAAQRVLHDGLARWEARARRGDATAVHHVAVYFWLNLDQELRAYWEARASAAGDPDFAGNAVRPGTRETALRDIRKALAPDAKVHNIADPWEKAATMRELRARLTRELNRRSLRR